MQNHPHKIVGIYTGEDVAREVRRRLVSDGFAKELVFVITPTAVVEETASRDVVSM